VGGRRAEGVHSWAPQEEAGRTSGMTAPALLATAPAPAGCSHLVRAAELKRSRRVAQLRKQAARNRGAGGGGGGGGAGPSRPAPRRGGGIVLDV
jgi:hypothetical protein